MNTPCMNCEKRCLGCHSTCEDYQAFRKERDRINDLKNAEKKKYCEYVEELERKKKRLKFK